MYPRQQIVCDTLRKFLCGECAECAEVADGLATLVLLALGIDERPPEVRANFKEWEAENNVRIERFKKMEAERTAREKDHVTN